MSKKPLAAKIANDKRTAEISVDATMTAAELETLIARLATIRAHLIPPVPETVKELAGLPSTHEVPIQDNPSFEVIPLVDGRIRFWVRNLGLGWLAFNVLPKDVEPLRDYLTAHHGDGGGHSIFNESSGSPFPPH